MKTIVTFDLDSPIPSKKNNKQIWKNRNTGKPFITSSNKYKAWHEVASYQIALQKKSIEGVEFPIKKCDYIHSTLFYGTLRGKDNTNVVESIHDLLVDNGIIIDDNWKVTGETKQIPIYREKLDGAKIEIKIADSV